MQNEIKITWQFNQPPHEVWEYLTTPELIEQWLAKTDFQPIVGHEFSLLSKDCKTISCKVLEVIPFTKLSYSWKYTSAIDNKPFDSKVIWVLVEKENGTELQIVHNSFTGFEDFISHNNGWTKCVSRLTELLNTIKI